MSKNNAPKVSVVIPTYNGWRTLKSCIISIQNQTLKPSEIIVVDNGSKDGTPQKVNYLFRNVRLISLKENSGVTGGRNKGIEETSPSSDFILFFDHDMVADKKMLEELIGTFQIDQEIGIVTPKIYYDDDKKRIWAAGTGINLWTGQIFFRGGKDKGQYERIEEVQVAPAVLLVKRIVIKKLKLFDDRYFATYEDTDFCFRAKRAGFKVFYTPKAFAFHKIPSEHKEESIRLLSRAYLVGRNRILFMKDFGNNFFVFLLFLPIFIIYYLRLALVSRRFSAWIKFIYGILEGLSEVILSKKIIFKGERPSLADIEGQHLAKYKFALKFCQGKKILEMGCGSGYGSRYLAKSGVKEITAYDIDPKAINFAIKNSSHDNINFLEGDVQNLRVKDKYDVVLSFEVIEHLQRPEKLLELAKKVLRKGGIFILSTPNKSYSILDHGKPSNPYHIKEYYPDELKKILLKYFELVELYGVILDNKGKLEEETKMHSTLRWRLINFLVNKRWVRRFMNYLPEYPKRLISGEANLSFETEDFKVLKNRADVATDFVAVCG